MATPAFGALRYARRLREAGVPEPQADARAKRHSFMLGLIGVVQVVPQLQAWLVH